MLGGVPSGGADIAETGADMTWFPTAGYLASWAGVCPAIMTSAVRVPRVP